MDDDFTTHCLELLAPLGTPRARRMFGGRGLYVDDVFVALISSERLYLKTDADTHARFEAAGCEPFTFQTSGGPMTTSYFSAPDDAMESPALMQPWARLALEAALRARAAKPASARAKAKAKPPAKAARPRRPAAKT
jgi:DNA transformation protein and related proteins